MRFASATAALALVSAVAADVTILGKSVSEVATKIANTPRANDQNEPPWHWEVTLLDRVAMLTLLYDSSGSIEDVVPHITQHAEHLGVPQSAIKHRLTIDTKHFQGASIHIPVTHNAAKVLNAIIPGMKGITPVKEVPRRLSPWTCKYCKSSTPDTFPGTNLNEAEEDCHHVPRRVDVAVDHATRALADPDGP
ncbi:hypothetical protein BDK51DRAFT_41202 [Blyttiomyces helicus]|uniref:Uncharacterized protein n=1 Tax=Blyttiomyces helicus TaxID=388810 RepID=A0A4P9W567_9FUNG|nr:hypothetical protein BDK51DRAFT_41202 [Blyttiomyces helicus]|eukprot:RKO86038.1 hypothetical protein BDK51DRAFT_41202 [Blyttiomyces helicus]